MKYINSKYAPEPVGPYSDAVRSGNLLFISGRAPVGSSGKLVGKDITEQTRQAMKNLISLLVSAGLGVNNLVKATVYLADWNDFDGYNEVYKQTMGNHKPARTTVEVKRLTHDALIEMEFIAEFPN